MFLLATMVLLTAAGWAVAWRANSPSDGTTINVADLAVSPSGVVLHAAASGSPLRAGDEITKIDGVSLATSVDARIGGAQPLTAGPLRYEIRRDGVPMTVRVTPGAYPVSAHLLDALPSVLVCVTLLGMAAALFAIRPGAAAAYAALLTAALAIAAAAGSGFFQLEAVDLVAGGQFWRWFGGEVCFLLLWPVLLHFALAFPELTPRNRFRVATRAGYAAVVGGYAAVAGFGLIFAAPLARLGLAGSPSLAVLFPLLPVLATVLYGAYLHNKQRSSLERQGFVVGSLAFGALFYFGLWTLPTVAGWTPLPAEYQVLAFLPVPLAVAAVIIRSRALTIDVAISRTLVYSALSVLLILVYIGVVSTLSVLLPWGGPLWQHAIAAAVIALAVQPVRTRLKATVNARIFGENADPYRVVAALAARLETMRTPAQQLQAVVDTIGAALRLPYVAIELDRAAGTEKAASFGTPATLSHRLALTHQGERVGELVVAQSNPDGMLGRKEHAVLAEVARHAGAVVYTARLTTDLIRSRETLVRAREQERKQLLRELHDGVVPTLSAITLGLHASRGALGKSDPVESLLAQLQEALSGAVTELRRMAHGLRPPALESLGLLGAVREHIMTCGSVNGETANGVRPRILLDAPAELPALPAAVDVAAYRIVCEALTNVSRHANARNCTVKISADGPLRIDITDDGTGLPARRVGGIGLSSMRERAAELGGVFRAERMDGGGTRIRAELPLPPVPVEERA
jgi:signal transduction histidine kinase